MSNLSKPSKENLIKVCNLLYQFTKEEYYLHIEEMYPTRCKKVPFFQYYYWFYEEYKINLMFKS
jgi:hypothetical protein